MNMMSLSPHSTSVQNCLTAPAMTGPRQTTGVVSSGSSRFRLMVLMPVLLTTGKMVVSVPWARSVRPNMRGTEGPVTSASSTAVR